MRRITSVPAYWPILPVESLTRSVVATAHIMNFSYISHTLLWVDISAVLPADAVTTGEVNCNTIIVRLRSLSRLAKSISQGYCCAEQRHIACEDGLQSIHGIQPV